MKARTIFKAVLYAVALIVALLLSFALYIVAGADDKAGIHTPRPMGLVSVLTAVSWIIVSVLNRWRKRP